MSDTQLSDERATYTRGRRQRFISVFYIAVLMTAFGVLAGGITAYYEYTRPATYRSAVALLIDQPQQIAASTDEGVVNKLARLRTKYVGIIGTQVFAQPVASTTGLPVGAVAGSLRAAADQSSLLLVITATLSSPADAHNVAAAAANELISYTNDEQARQNIKTDERISFSVLTPATVAGRVTPDRRRAVLVGVLVFVAFTIVGGLGADLLRRRERRQRALIG